jgi:hypothetical protein
MVFSTWSRIVVALRHVTVGVTPPGAVDVVRVNQARTLRDMTNAPLVAGIPGAVLAHQGGWDEILLVVGPVAVVVGLLVLARHRVRRGGPAVSPPGAPAGDGSATRDVSAH